MSVTIKDVAQIAGVSLTTVSRVLNDQSGFSAKTRDKVWRAIRQSGYQPSNRAAGTASPNKIVGVLVPRVNNNFMAKFLAGVEERAYELGFSVIVCHTGSDGVKTERYIKILAENNVAGVIFGSWCNEASVSRALRYKIPVVLAWTNSRQHQVPFIKIDDQQATYLATQYLIDKGHRQIAFLGGTETDTVAGKPRYLGFCQAMKDNGLEAAPDRIIFGNFHYDSGVQCFQQLMEKEVEMTALLAASDDMAMGVISEAYRRGIKVPEQLSVMGIDDTDSAVRAIPPLTTVHQPIHEMGVEAMSLVLSYPQTPICQFKQVYIEERESVQAL